MKGQQLIESGVSLGPRAITRAVEQFDAKRINNDLIVVELQLQPLKLFGKRKIVKLYLRGDEIAELKRVIGT